MPSKQNHKLEYLLALEDLSLTPDQLVSYFFWADDKAPDGSTRRTASDMYFAEIRPFDEIFRQGQPPTTEQMRQQQQQQQQPGSQNAQQAEQLAELQKQIINATWNIIRRETAAQVSGSFVDDVHLVGQSQSSASEQVEALAQQLQDAKSLVYVGQVRQSMEQAAGNLETAASDVNSSELYPALYSEQAAYQGLLKLRSREHEVVRMNMQRGQAGQQNNSSRQQQLQQLELQNDRNPYEEQRLAENQESPEAKENRQVLNRLRELARRQNDLNERIKELQSALEQANDAQQRAELERRLQRLRDEQQQVLRDTDELRDRMQNEQNQQQMAEQAQQLDQARENIRQSSGALQNNQLSRAAAEGQRAQNQLEELRDEFQRRTSNQFSDEMRQMRDRARQLEQDQQQLADQLNNLQRQNGEQPSLRDEDPRGGVANQLQQQQDRLKQLQQSMKETIEKSEDVEPLLAQELYDTYRNAEQQKASDLLDSARRLVTRGLDDEAKNDERRGAIRSNRSGKASTKPPRASWATKPNRFVEPATTSTDCRKNFKTNSNKPTRKPYSVNRKRRAKRMHRQTLEPIQTKTKLQTKTVHRSPMVRTGAAIRRNWHATGSKIASHRWIRAPTIRRMDVPAIAPTRGLGACGAVATIPNGSATEIQTCRCCETTIRVRFLNRFPVTISWIGRIVCVTSKR